MELLEQVKTALGITGTYQDDTIQFYIDEVQFYLKDSGVSDDVLNSQQAFGVIARGVSDLWNYGSGKLSEYFYQRADQLRLGGE